MVLSAEVKSPIPPSEGTGCSSGESPLSSQVLRRKCLRGKSSGSIAVTEQVAEGRSSIRVNEWHKPGWAIVGVLRDGKP